MTAKTAIIVGKKVIATVSTEEGRNKLVTILFGTFMVLFLALMIPILLVQNAVDKIADYFGLSEQEIEELEDYKEQMKEYFPEEFEDEGNVELNGDYPVPLSGKVRITSKYGYRMDPKTKERAFHAGIDMVSNISSGGNIIAIADGTVISSLPPTQSRGYGNMVMIYHEEEDFYTLYAHMSERRVFEGDKVKSYQVLGIEGATGRVTGRHLHFEMRRKLTKDSAFNPYPYLFKKKTQEEEE